MTTTLPKTSGLRFAEFHDANPLVYELVKKYTFDVLRTGKKSFSMTSILNASAGTQQSKHLVKSSKSTRISFLTTRECSWPTTRNMMVSSAYVLWAAKERESNARLVSR